MLHLTFEARIIHWRGPAPFFFAAIPAQHVEAVREAARLASYGWGVVPVTAMVQGVSFTTSLFPKDDGYLLPIKAAVRKAAGVTESDLVRLEMTVAPRQPSFWPPD